LTQVLRHVPSVTDPRVLVSAETRDDAAVFQLTDDRAIVATLDFFTPIVDDAYAFGAIAAANAFSDVYAMGAKPLFALNLVAWPRDPEMLELLAETVRGGSDTAARAGALVLGGHSVDDPEPKYGMVAIGEAHPAEIRTVSRAVPGDMLVLTKPLGTGILSTALKRDAIQEREMAAAVTAMSTLNADAADAMRALGDAVHAATDVTGFGLLGHLRNMVTASRRRARIHTSQLPVFEHVKALIEAGHVPGGTKRNQEQADEYTTWGRDVGASMRTLVCDAQTSGGLLIAVAPDRTDQLVAELKKRGTPSAAVIGEIEEGEGIVVD